MFFGFRQLAAGLLMSLAALSSVQAQNLLQNGNFEQFDSVTAPWFWNFTWGGELITTDAPQGNVYARCATGSFYHTTGVYTQTDTVYEVSFLGSGERLGGGRLARGSTLMGRSSTMGKCGFN